MRVVHIIGTRIFGGAEAHILSLLLGLRKISGMETCLVVFHDSPLVAKARKENISVRLFDIPRKFDLLAFVRLVRFLKRYRPHIVHTHGSKANLLGRLAAKLAGVEFVVTTVHSFIEADMEMNRVKRALWGYLDFSLVRLSDKLITVSNQLREHFLSRGITPAKVATIYNGVDSNLYLFNPRPDACQLSGSFIVGTVARLTREKGLENLLKAAKTVLTKYPEAHFTVVGDGPRREELESLGAELGIANKVNFVGHRDDVSEYWKAFTVFVLPSLLEGTPRVILEAMAVGCPVVASCVGGIPEIIEDGQTGILISSGNPEKLAQAIEELLGDSQKRQQLQINARDIIEKKFSLTIMTERTYQVYQALVGDIGEEREAPSRASHPGGCDD